MAPLFHLAMMTAARRGEILGLRWADVDLDAATMSVRHNRVAVAYAVSEGTPKTRRGIRVVDLDAGTVAVLRRWRKTQTEEHLVAGPAWADSGYVFTDVLGALLHGRRLRLGRRPFGAAEDPVP